jgi:hypothetical protein
MAERKPPPEGWERHPQDFNLIRRKVVPTAAQAMFPNLRSSSEARRQEDEAEAKERIRRDKWR